MSCAAYNASGQVGRCLQILRQKATTGTSDTLMLHHTYRLAVQPAASAVASSQNHRSPSASSISVCE